MLGEAVRTTIIFRLFCLLGCALTLSSCIVTYQDFPQAHLESTAVPVKKFPLHYRIEAPVVIGAGLNASYAGGTSDLMCIMFPYFYPYLCNGPPGPWKLAQELERSLTDYSRVSAAFVADSPPEKGIYCMVAVETVPPSKTVEYFHTTMAVITLIPAVAGSLAWYPPLVLPVVGYVIGAIPYYTEEGGYVVRYTLYIDNDMKQEYRYEIRKKGVGWIGLLPFAWVNFFTTSLRDAFSATTHQFFIDSERDGYLQQT